MYAFYIARGHKLSDLEDMHQYEKWFYQAAMSKYYDDLFAFIETVVVSYLGDDKARRDLLRRMEKEERESREV